MEIFSQIIAKLSEALQYGFSFWNSIFKKRFKLGKRLLFESERTLKYPCRDNFWGVRVRDWKIWNSFIKNLVVSVFSQGTAV